MFSPFILHSLNAFVGLCLQVIWAISNDRGISINLPHWKNYNKISSCCSLLYLSFYDNISRFCQQCCNSVRLEFVTRVSFWIQCELKCSCFTFTLIHPNKCPLLKIFIHEMDSNNRSWRENRRIERMCRKSVNFTNLPKWRNSTL